MFLQSHVITRKVYLQMCYWLVRSDVVIHNKCVIIPHLEIKDFGPPSSGGHIDQSSPTSGEEALCHPELDSGSIHLIDNNPQRSIFKINIDRF